MANEAGGPRCFVSDPAQAKDTTLHVKEGIETTVPQKAATSMVTILQCIC